MNHTPQDYGKTLSLQKILPVIQSLRNKKKKIVWTNGCFDILHAGHVLLLNQAKAHGDILVVGINTDISVKKLKGSDRPVNNCTKRAYVLCGLRAVDFVVPFGANTPLNILKKLKPDIYIKGGDYSIDTINQQEKKAIESYGGKIVMAGLKKGLSTTSIIKNIKMR